MFTFCRIDALVLAVTATCLAASAQGQTSVPPVPTSDEIVPPLALSSVPAVTRRLVEYDDTVEMNSMLPLFVNPVAYVRFEEPVVPSGWRRTTAPDALVNVPLIALVPFVISVPWLANAVLIVELRIDNV